MEKKIKKNIEDKKDGKTNIEKNEAKVKSNIMKAEKKAEKCVNKAVKTQKVKYRTAEQTEMIKFFWVIVVVLVCVVGIYFLTRIFVTKDLFNDKSDKNEVVEGVVNYSVTSVGQILNRPYDEYYVLIFDTTGEKNSDMTSLMTSYNSKQDHIHLYTVDLSNYMNKKFYNPKKENVSATKVSDMMFGDMTLIKVKNGAVKKYITGLEQMSSELGIDKK